MPQFLNSPNPYLVLLFSDAMALASTSCLPFAAPAPGPLPLRRPGCVRIRAATDPALLRRPLVSSEPATELASAAAAASAAAVAGVDEEVGFKVSGSESARDVKEITEQGDGEEEEEDEEEWVDWEDMILQDTVPLVGFVRMVLHSGQYNSGDRLSAEHQKAIVDRLLAYHPQCDKKIGSGIDFITIGYHPEFENSRCLFIVRNDGELVDFSFWKCIKGLIRQKYPVYADTFIFRHFKRTRNFFANLQND